MSPWEVHLWHVGGQSATGGWQQGLWLLGFCSNGIRGCALHCHGRGSLQSDCCWMWISLRIINATTTFSCCRIWPPKYCCPDTRLQASYDARCLIQGEELHRSGRLAGGVLTPASACGMHLIERLKRSGFTFEIKMWIQTSAPLQIIQHWIRECVVFWNVILLCFVYVG